MTLNDIVSRLKVGPQIQGAALLNGSGRVATHTLPLDDRKVSAISTSLHNLLTICRESGRSDNRFLLSQDDKVFVFSRIGERSVLFLLRGREDLDAVMRAINNAAIAQASKSGTVVPPFVPDSPVSTISDETVQEQPQAQPMTPVDASYVPEPISQPTPQPAAQTSRSLLVTDTVAKPVTPYSASLSKQSAKSKGPLIIGIIAAVALTAAAGLFLTSTQVESNPAEALTETPDSASSSITPTSAKPLSTEKPSPPVAANTAPKPPSLRIHGHASLAKNLLVPLLVQQAKDTSNLALRSHRTESDYTVRLELSTPSGPEAIEITPMHSNEAFFSSKEEVASKVGLSSGKADVALSEKEVANHQINKLKSLGIDLNDPKTSFPLAIDALTLVLHPDNPTRTINLKQLSLILTGQVTNWKQFGWNDAPITVYSRGWLDNNLAEFERYFSRPQGLTFIENSKFVRSAAGMVKHVLKDPNAVGLLNFSELPKKLRALSIYNPTMSRPVSPTEQSIASLDYPLSYYNFLYTPKDDLPFLSRFQSYVRTEQGHAAVRKAGWVPIRNQSLIDATPSPLLRFIKISENRIHGQLAKAFDQFSREKTVENIFYVPGEPIPDDEVDRVSSAWDKSHEVVIVAHSHQYSDATEVASAAAQGFQRQLETNGVQNVTTINANALLSVVDSKDPTSELVNNRLEIWMRKKS